MKKFIALLLALAAAVMLFTACGTINVNVNVPRETTKPTTPPAVDAVPAERITTFTHRGLWIRVSDAFIPNGQDMLSSTEEKTDIHIIDISSTQVEENYGITGPLEDVAKAHAAYYNIEAEVFAGAHYYYYALREGSDYYDDPYTILSVFLMNEDGEFFEVRFTSYGRSWSDVQEEWESYIATIQFEEYVDMKNSN